MKKLLTLLLALCIVATLCALPAGAASYDFDCIRSEYEPGTPIRNYVFEDTTVVEDFDKDKGNSIEVSDGCLVAVGDETTGTIDINMPAETSASDSKYVLFSYEFSIDKSSVVKFRLGPNDRNTEQYMQMDFYSGSVNAYKDTTNYTTFNFEQKDVTKVDILADLNNNCYYAWINVADNKLFVTDPLVDKFPFTNNCTDGYVKILRMWTGTLTETTTINFDNYSVTPLKQRVLIPRYTEYYEENFDSYTAGSDDFKTAVGSILEVPSGTGNPIKCNPDGLSITNEGSGDNRLTVAYGGGNYHNWYYPTVKPNPSESFVVQVDVKGYGGEGHIRLGGYNDSEVPVAIKGYTNGTMQYLVAGTETEISGAPKFMYSNQASCDAADYVTLTFLVNGDYYYLWANDTCLLENVKKSNTSNDINSICFYVKASDVVLYIDNLRVFDGDAFLKVYNFMNSAETGFDDCISVGSDSNIESFKSADEIFGADSGATVIYSDDKSYYNGTDIEFPLFGGEANSRVIFMEDDNIIASIAETIAFPSGYTTIGSATKAGNTVSIPVTLRNSASAREDELLVIAAAYDATTDALVASKRCALNSAKDAFVAEFDTDVSEYEVKGFVWQNGTLRPVQ